MPRFLANEDAPLESILAARAAGFDVAWRVELQPGADDNIVLSQPIDWVGDFSVAREGSIRVIPQR